MSSSSKAFLGLFAALAAAQSTTSPPTPGQTLSNGAYACNPAHSYPAGASCDGKASPPTLIYYSVTAAPSAGYTLSNGAYVCNPAHSYPAGASCDGKASPPTLVYPSTTAAPSAGYTLSNGAYVCNPAHSYPAGASCDGKASPPTLVYPSTTPAVPKTTLATSTVSKSSVAIPASSASGCTAAVQSAQPSGKSCPLTLAGTDFQFPHLIVLSSDGKTTGTTQYNGTISSKTTSYFNFDIPPTYAGKSCDVVFSLPRQDQLETSSFHLGGNGNLVFSSLETAASENGNVPKTSAKLGSWTPTPGYHFAVASGSCAAGQRIGFSVAAEGDRYLDYFQDYNPCPIGLYIIAH